MPSSQGSEEADLLEEQASIGRTGTDSYESTIFNLATPNLPQVDHTLRAKAALYTSHFLSTWGERMWEFAIAFGLVDGGVQIVSGAFLGTYVDRAERLRFACSMYILQNVAVAVSALSALISYHSQQGSAMFWIGTACTIIVGSISSIGAQGSLLSVEKEWTAALCEEDSAALAQLNAGMRGVDLSCLLLSPIAAGFLMTYAGMPSAILVIALWNLTSWLPECYLLYVAQQASSALRAPKMQSHKHKHRRHPVASLWQGWGPYFRQGIWPAALALALLYLTVLSLGLMMTAYLKWVGMTEAELSLYRGAGAVSGLLATAVFPFLHRPAGLKATGLAGIWWQLLALAIAVFPVWLTQLGARIPEASTTHVLLGGLVASRFGLWLFDLAVSQMLQEWVTPEELGAVNGAQSSIQNLMQSLSYVAGLIFWRPSQFPGLMFASTAVVLCAAVLYSAFTCLYRQRE